MSNYKEQLTEYLSTLGEENIASLGYMGVLWNDMTVAKSTIGADICADLELLHMKLDSQEIDLNDTDLVDLALNLPPEDCIYLLSKLKVPIGNVLNGSTPGVSKEANARGYAMGRGLALFSYISDLDKASTNTIPY